MNGELLEQWFKHHFLVHTPSIHPLLLLDGHRSHYNPAILRMAAEEGIIVLCLPLNTTHMLQPLDNGVFSSQSTLKKRMTVFVLWKPGKAYKPLKLHGRFCESVGIEDDHHNCCVMLQISESLPSWPKGTFKHILHCSQKSPNNPPSLCALLPISKSCCQGHSTQHSTHSCHNTTCHLYSRRGMAFSGTPSGVRKL